jgi:diguanylate cyclase (GGDEF)-like protein
MRVGLRRVAGSAWLPTVVYLAWIGCPGLSVSLRVFGADAGMTTAPGVAAFLLLRAARERRDSRLWFLGSAAAAWFTGNIIWVALVLVTGDRVPFPSLADPFYLLFLPLVAAGLLNLPDTATRAVGRARALCDSLLSVAGLLTVAWPLLLSPVLRRESDLFSTLVGVSYGTGDFLLLALIVPIVVRAASVWRPVLLRIGLALLGFTVADVGFAFLVDRGTYTSYSLTTAGWVLAFGALSSLVRVWPSAQRPANQDGRVPDSTTKPPTGKGRRGVVAMVGYLPVLAGTATALGQLLGGNLGVVTGIAVLVIVGLGSIRQQLVLWENEALTRDLESRVQRRTRELAQLAYTDLLTGLANRASFARHLSAAASEGQIPVVVLLDLDGFKVVNDTLGHAAGDELLARVAGRLRQACPEADLLARLGGDEFAIVLSADAAPGATYVADQVLAELTAPFRLQTGGLTEVRVAASIGIAGLPLPDPDSRPIDTGDVLRDADLAMYSAKAAGRNRWRTFDPVMRRAAEDRKALEDDLRGALRAGELDVAYQPVVNLASGDIVGVEALLRWNHPVRGAIAPDEFIPVAEETGLIVPIGAWILRQACQQAADWKRQLGESDEFSCGINLSVHQLQPGLVGLVERVLAETGLSPGALVLEVTESVFMDDGRTDPETLQQLRRLGTKIFLDDFGTGYSSLGYLRRFPVDGLKIDRSFVAPLSGEGEDAIPSAILSLAKSLQLNVVAEGIEEPLQQAVLTAMGCLLGQGFGLHRPMPAEAMNALLADRFRSTGTAPAVTRVPEPRFPAPFGISRHA